LSQPEKEELEMLSIDEGIHICLRERPDTPKLRQGVKNESINDARSRCPSMHIELLGNSCWFDCKKYVHDDVVVIPSDSADSA
jgi:hypothetical protein